MMSVMGFFAAAALWIGSAAAAGVADGLSCLDAHDLPCAQAVLEKQQKKGDDSPALAVLEGRVRFHEGDFRAAAVAFDRALLSNPDDERVTRDRDLAIATAEVAEGLIETTRGDITVAHHPGVDRVLVDGVIDSLSAARERIAPLLGGVTPVPLRVEIYPTGTSFVVASGLPPEAVKTTGVIAISKWHRLLITSPRALGRGYGWQDTIVHEWIHLVVSWHTRDQAPVWLQEGIAKSLDTLWRVDGYALPVRSQSALAQAIRDDDFVTFEEMHPSMAFLPSADRTALAYAQVATMMLFLRQEKGEQALVDVLERVGEGEDARDAVAQVYNGGDFDGFEADWRLFIEGLDLVQERLASLPVVLDGEGDEFDNDPSLAGREDLAGKARLGDLMAMRGHHDAALKYYEQASPEGEPAGPVLTQHTAEALIALGRDREAESLLRDNLVFYDESAANHRLMAELLIRDGRKLNAREHLLHSAAINPYDIAVHEALVTLYEEAEDDSGASRHKGYLDILNYRDTVAF